MTTSTLTNTTSAQQRMIIGLISLLMGMGMVFATGLAQDSRMHGAAHDTRHASGFPCH